MQSFCYHPYLAFKVTASFYINYNNINYSRNYHLQNEYINQQ